MFSRRLKSGPSKSGNKPVIKKKYANILEYLADNGINPNVTREELKEVLKISDGRWQQLCVDSGLDCIPSANDFGGKRKRKIPQLNEDRVGVRKKALLNKVSSFTPTQCAGDSSMDVTGSTALTKDTSVGGSVNILQDSDFMTLAATANTTAASTTIVYETTIVSSHVSSVNIQDDSTFMALADKTTSTNLSRNKDFTLVGDVTDTGEHTSLGNVTPINTDINASTAKKDISIKVPVRQKDGIKGSRRKGGRFKTTGDEASDVATSKSRVVPPSKGTRYNLRKRPKLNSIEEESSLDNHSGGKKISSITLQGCSVVDNRSLADDNTLEASSQQTEIGSIHLPQDDGFVDLAGIPSFKDKPKSRGRKFNVPDKSTAPIVGKNNDSKDLRRGRGISKTTGEEVSGEANSKGIVASQTNRTRYNLRKRPKLDSIEKDPSLENQDGGNETSSAKTQESVVVSSRAAKNDSALEPSSQQTEMQSIRLLQDQDFRVLAGIPNTQQKSKWRGRKLNGSIISSDGRFTQGNKKNIKGPSAKVIEPSVKILNDRNSNGIVDISDIPKRSRWRREASNATYESTATAIESDGSSDRLTAISINSASFAIPHGPVIPRNNFDVSVSMASESTPFVRRMSPPDISTSSIDPRVLPKPIRARKNLDVSSFLNDNPQIAFQEIQQKRKAKIIVNNDTSDKELFKNDSVVEAEEEVDSIPALPSQTFPRSQGNGEVNEEVEVPRRSKRTRKRRIVNVNDSIFQTITPAVRKLGKKVLSQSKPTNIETAISRSCSPASVMSEGYSEFPLLIDENDVNLNNSSKKPRKHAVIRRKKEKQKVLVVKKPKIIKPNEDQIQFTTLRRSRRNRIPPVDGTLLQKPIYERDENGLLTLVGVNDVEVKDPLFVKYGTVDFAEINNIRAVQRRAKQQKKLAKDQNLAYYGIKHCK
uniref:H15 domain-containing protein n=1 Tax=Strongyloides venezuelensis TaxID=75913 RepID=A0A0K0FQ27_STRVS